MESLLDWRKKELIRRQTALTC